LGSLQPGLSYRIGMKGAYHNINNNLNMQMLVFGSPGSFKTTSVVLPNVFHIPYIFKDKTEKADLVITDPKSELFILTSKYLEDNGYDVKVLDFIDLKYGDSLNPIEFISSDKELMEVAEGFISSVTESSNITFSSDSFWEESEGQLLGALIGFVRHVFPEGRQTFKEVLGVLTSDDVKNYDKANSFFKKFGVTGAAGQLWNNFLLSEDKVRANILIGLATKLKMFSIEGVEKITSTTTIDIAKLGNKKERPIALFILMPDKDRTFSPIINSIMTAILNQLYKTANSFNGVLFNPVFLILEEMANIGRIPDIEIMLGTMRSRRIYPLLVFQSLPQMQNRYKDSWEDILSMCDTHYYLGINDNLTAQYCSKFLGNTTIKVQSDSSSLGGGIFDIARKSESQSYYTRNLLLPDELKRLEQSVAVLNQRSLFPSMLYKVQYKFWNEVSRICDFNNLKDLQKIGKF
jgi:type IV secretory pathway TraG/TraD family ATPase VirD4